ncbi:MAG: hypothetical protein R3E50_15325 [Halioglobus sp.]
MILEFLFRWAHVLFGIVWIGMLYYFNFVQGEYFKEAEAGAKADALKKLAPRALGGFAGCDVHLSDGSCSPAPGGRHHQYGRNAAHLDRRTRRYIGVP